jgi:SAM-dependent methyltransferase
MRFQNLFTNSSEMWDRLLNQSDYLNDENAIVTDRMKIAKKWAINSKRILNIGSGQGYFEKNYLDKLNYNLFVCADISMSGLRRLQSFPVSLVNLSATSLPFKNGAFDLVMCLEVLEHIDSRIVANTYSEIKRIISPEGRIILSVPVFEPVTLVNHPVGHMRKYVPLEFYQELKLNDLVVLETIEIYAFSRFRKLMTCISSIFQLRRPSVVMALCKKSKS